jgi:hypothetical protein
MTDSEMSASVDEKRPAYSSTDPDLYIYDSASGKDSDTGKGVSSTAIGQDGDFDEETGKTLLNTSLDTNLQLVTKTLDCSDDPTINPYTVSFWKALKLYLI